MSVILGIDNGLRNFGWAAIDDQVPGPIGGGLIETENSSAKLHLHAADDNQRRGLELARDLAIAFHQYRPDVVAMESLTCVRSATASQGMGIAFGVVLALSRASGVRIYQYPPKDAKKRLTGYRTATKVAIEEALLGQGFDMTPWLLRSKQGKVLKGKKEHIWDACLIGWCHWQEMMLIGKP